MNTKALKSSVGRRWGNWEDRSQLLIHHTNRNVHRALLNRFYSVQVALIRTEWGLIDHMIIRRHDESCDVSWADKQRIKNELMGAERIAIEVFPKESELVNDANCYHLWVFPIGFAFPIRLS